MPRAAVVAVGAGREAAAVAGAGAAGAGPVDCRVAAHRVGVAVAIAAARARAFIAILSCLAARSMTAQQAAWVMGPQAKLGLQELWATSLTARREQVACLGGVIRPDTVFVSRLRLVDEFSDSLTASAQLSLSTCAPPEWIGTVHSHVRATDDASPAPRFSPGDRAVMSEWATRWGGQGAFCLVYSERNMHCEVYPPRHRQPAAGDTT